MNIIPANPTQGTALFEGTQSFYQHASDGDTFDGSGNLVQSPLTLSGTEVESWCDWMRTINSVVKPIVCSVTAINATGAVPQTASVVTSDATSGAVTLTLPSAATVGNGKTYRFKKIDASGNSVTVNTSSSQTIDGASSKSLTTQWQSLTVISDGTNWLVF